MTTEEVNEELEALIAILEDDTVEVVKDEGSDRPKDLYIKITPLTEGEQEKQYVSLTLVIALPEGYPGSPPSLGVRNPRGLEDTAVKGLLAEMTQRCEDYRGCPVLFELIEMAREFLTVRNVPVVSCIICLFNLQEEDQITKTECLHFFHKHCLGRYITNMQETYEEQRAEALSQNNNITVKEFVLSCPVCRETIGESRYNLSELVSAPPPLSSAEETPEYCATEEIRRLQNKMKKLYLKQQQKGGIIDLEAEGKKLLVVTGSGSEPQQGETGGEGFTELSPTDYQLDSLGFHCPKAPSGPSSPKKTGPEWTDHRPEPKNIQGGGKRGGRGSKNKGVHNKADTSNKGKSHHQQKKGKAL